MFDLVLRKRYYVKLREKFAIPPDAKQGKGGRQEALFLLCAAIKLKRDKSVKTFTITTHNQKSE